MMKTIFRTRTALIFAPLCALLASGCATNSPPERQAVYVGASSSPGYGDEVYIQSVDDFDEPLSPYGEWVVVGSYGRCWRPSRVDASWRPYSSGQWVYTDAGWCWQSDEPWGWATYHYGRWDFDVSFGWLWFPETQWAPAWVEWRSGGGYIGWAPTPPARRRSSWREREDRAYVFVPEPRFVESVRPSQVIVNNTTIVHQTVNITNTTVVNNTVINQGPRVDVVERASGRKVAPVPVNTFRRTQEASVVSKHPALAHGQSRRAAPAPASTPRAERTAVPQNSASQSPDARPRGNERTAPITTAPDAPRREERPADVRRERPAPASRENDNPRSERTVEQPSRAPQVAPEQRPRRTEAVQPTTPPPDAQREERPSQSHREAKPTPQKAPPDTSRAERPSEQPSRAQQVAPEQRPRRVEPVQPASPPPAARREERPSETRREASPSPQQKASPGSPPEKKGKPEKKPKKDDDDKGDK